MYITIKFNQKAVGITTTNRFFKIIKNENKNSVVTHFALVLELF